MTTEPKNNESRKSSPLVDKWMNLKDSFLSPLAITTFMVIILGVVGISGWITIRQYIQSAHESSSETQEAFSRVRG